MNDTEKQETETPGESLSPEEDAAYVTEDEPAADDTAEGPYQQEIAQLKDQLLRAVAEAENTRRRARLDVEEAGKYAVSGFARDIVAVVDNLQRAADSIPADKKDGDHAFKTLAEGVELTLRELLGALEKHGVARVDPMGQPFDHNLHQAVVQIESDEAPGTVVQVIQHGYTLKDRLLRPAMVGVAKEKSES